MNHTKKARKHNKKHTRKNGYAKKAVIHQHSMKSCHAKKYQSIYGASYGGRVRYNRALYY